MNIYDIAHEAGVSISTVSKFLNNKTVKPELAKRIEEVIKKYNYVPSAIAQGLVSKSMKTIAVMVVDLRMPHYASTAFSIDNVLSPLGYRVIICNTLGDVKNSIKYIESLLKINIDGIIFVGSVFEFLNDNELLLDKLKNIPIVCSNGKIKSNLSKSIYVDDKKGIYDACKYLIEKGKTNICYVKYLDTASANKKLSGYVKCMEDYNLPINYIQTFDFFDGGYKTIEEHLKDNLNYDAYVCGEDIIAVGICNALKDHNINLENISVIGYNASEYTELCSPKLTSIDNLSLESAKTCALELKNLMDGNKDLADIILEPKLIIKKSA